MYPDLETRIATDLAVTDSEVSSEEVLKFPETNPNKGEGTPLRMRVTVKEAFATSDSCTLTLKIADSANGSAWTEIITTDAKAATALTKGTIIDVPLPMKHRQYVKMLLTPLTATSFTAGKVDIDLIP